MKTTVFGLTGYSPDFTMLVINANSGIGTSCVIFLLLKIIVFIFLIIKNKIKLEKNKVGTTKEHLGFSMALEVRVFIVVNKTDMCSDSCLERTLSTIEFLLKSPGCGE